jgi:hypothetical protein
LKIMLPNSNKNASFPHSEIAFFACEKRVSQGKCVTVW